MSKIAYPNEDFGLYNQQPRNIQKWIKSMSEVFNLVNRGFDFKDAFAKITEQWDVMEKLDFKNWMNFYQEKAQEKYKFAQFAGFDNGPGSYVPNVNSLKANIPFKQPDMTPYSNVSPEEAELAKQELVRQKIQAIISRLSAAEKLATNPDVQIALKKCIDMSLVEWLSMLQQLKREIQLAPMRATSVSLADDIIVKNANRCIAAGKYDAGLLLIKIAQGLPGVGGDIPAMNPAVAPMAMQPNMPADGDNSGTEAIQEFLKNMNGDIASSDDEKIDEEDEDALITVTAQAVPPGAALPQEQIQPAVEQAAPENVELDQEIEPALEVSEDEIVPEANEQLKALEPAIDDTDPIDLALENISLGDVVARLEGIASLFKNRQIARQLSIIDLMMDKLGIAPFFPTLAEAMRSALESNQYCQSRVEEILAKLRGTMPTAMSEGLSNSQESSIKEHLQEEENADKARKEHRKQVQRQEEDQIIGVEKAEPGPPQQDMINAPQEVDGPARVQTQPQAVRPIG